MGLDHDHRVDKAVNFFILILNTFPTPLNLFLQILDFGPCFVVLAEQLRETGFQDVYVARVIPDL